MEQQAYLYGASVQGIQKFIFQTNKLKDIIGASDIVKKVCDDIFKSVCDENKAELIVNAAGNIKCIFHDENACRKVVLLFPKKVREIAANITISQAVARFQMGGGNFKTALNELEKKLHAQRNKPAKSLTIGLMAMERARTTGLPAVKEKDHEFLDECTLVKRYGINNSYSQTGKQTLQLCGKLFGREVLCSEIIFDPKDLTNNNNWIAIVHADGNGLGNIVAEKENSPEELRQFSLSLDEATEAAAQKACSEIESMGKPPYDISSIRPVVLGGDDLTIICRGDIAVDFTKSFLKHFEEETAKKIGKRLTACAGIAFTKSSFPFFYGYNLAEVLCDIAKKDAKSKEMSHDGIIPSCLMFHKIQSSVVEEFESIRKKELTAVDKNISYQFGPYYLEEQDGKRWTIEKLQENVMLLSQNEKDSCKNNIRQWLTDMAYDVEAAKQRKARSLCILNEGAKNLFEEATKITCHQFNGNKQACVPAYDLLSLHTILYQNTK